MLCYEGELRMQQNSLDPELRSGGRVEKFVTCPMERKLEMAVGKEARTSMSSLRMQPVQNPRMLEKQAFSAGRQEPPFLGDLCHPYLFLFFLLQITTLEDLNKM